MILVPKILLNCIPYLLTFTFLLIFSLTIVISLLQKYHSARKQIGRLEVRHEIVIDKSMSIKTFLMEVFLVFSGLKLYFYLEDQNPLIFWCAFWIELAKTSSSMNLFGFIIHKAYINFSE